ncbi:hypothetical protein A2344_03975 [Candidatus Peregrinibacteria bacterium RIFOXYB12_FULL_41_12]|nr:MAG: hypothetical protein A2244_01160 [Candidatus Peregrinibacteria bacterium RIFOXYA2_FULL_41_18]OGJ48263.1 MAG: hypothetical protein A2344_03975 [Candidatus Peregrinibacteria bacterium RIFOXYB12_FULL_41_12]OGJ52248.1 MAG: hypothetical protein A2336_05265 [Candidatus Peregrinibacteria bacterium RIFOXYB2_FULL_41_88]OGJ52932.1 MAG: hypothetical protein A2448_00615 [Candidatus Peregrinibacteria bacterium RIFOXYC2_FULL_41_22]
MKHLELQSGSDQRVLSQERETDILNAVNSDRVAFARYKIRYQHKTSARRNPREPQWASIATSPDGVRGVIAFAKRPCSYKTDNSGGGCTFCNLSIGNRDYRDVTTDDQLVALESALATILPYSPSVIELLPDGSFLNDDELSVDTQIGVMKRLAREPNVKKVAIETRPEFCQADKVRNLVEELREDQSLEIYFGLETTDEFISETIHNKGYGVEEFKDALCRIAQLDESLRRRINISVYSIIKPGYLSEKEAIASAIKTALDIKALSDDMGIPIMIKFEPAVVSDGTLQGYLYSQHRYEPLSYFSVAEVIAKLSEHETQDRAKFGQRDDIDSFSHVAMIPDAANPDMFSSADVVIYNAVQMFNVHRDIRRFTSEIACVIDSPEFKDWESRVCGDSGSSIRNLAHADNGARANDFQQRMLSVFNQIQSLNPSCNDFQNEASTICANNALRLVNIRNIKSIIGDKTNSSYFQAEIVILNDENFPQSIWIRIPICT